MTMIFMKSTSFALIPDVNQGPHNPQLLDILFPLPYHQYLRPRCVKSSEVFSDMVHIILAVLTLSLLPNLSPLSSLHLSSLLASSYSPLFFSFTTFFLAKRESCFLFILEALSNLMYFSTFLISSLIVLKKDFSSELKNSLCYFPFFFLSIIIFTWISYIYKVSLLNLET